MSKPSKETSLPDPIQTLYLIDISSFIFRAFFAIRSLRNKAGEPTNAVFGVATMIAKLAEEAKPEYLAVVYDSKEPSFREEIYPEYKANRSEPPEDLIPQFARIEELIRAFEIHSYRQSGVEADDLIATLARKWCQESSKHHVVIVSSDKDLMQLVDGQITIWDTMTNKRYGEKEVQEKFGVRPDQIRDYLGLVGDSSDNIPGVAGIGPKGAVELLKSYGNLDQILKAAEKGEIPGKKGESLRLYEGDARLSAQLATVKEDLPVKIPFQELKYHFHVTDDCVKVLQELEFHTLVTKWSGQKVKPQHDEAEDPELGKRFRTIHTEVSFQALLKELERTGEFGFDLETTSLNPRLAEIVGIAICYDPEFGCYIPLAHQDPSVPQLSKKYVLESLRPFIENSKYIKIGQNLKYDWSVLLEKGFRPKGLIDTRVAGYVLEPGGRYNLEALALHYLNYPVMTYEQVCGKGKDQICFDQVSIAMATRYSAEDAWIAVRLWKVLKSKLEAEGLTEIFYKVDLPLVQVLAEMECEGVCIDLDWLKKLSLEFGGEIEKIEKRIQTYPSQPVNLNSPKQLAHLLFEELKLPTQGRTKTGFSTDASVLEALAPLHEVPRLLLEYREISKLKGTYVDPLPEMLDPKTGKIHAAFNQTIAATGRLSSSDPNLQNIPIRTDRGMKIRKSFIPSHGNTLVVADYSQIELRLLAHMSGDPELIQSFQKDEDVHRRTASEIFKISPEAVSDSQRGIAKAINFGLMYGKTAFGLSQELKISRKEAQEVIDRYFARYHAVKTYLDSLITFAKEKGYVTTLMGRKRPLPEIYSKNHAIRTNAERMAMNSPIQGTAADIMKLAMIELSHRLETEKFKARLIIQVHDELVLDCPLKEETQIKKLVKEVMENVVSLSVPLRVNLGVGKNWLDL